MLETILVAPYNFLQRSVLEKRNESDSSRISHGAISGGRHGDVLFVREECKDRSQPRGIPQQRSGQSTSAFVGSRSWVPPEIHPPLSLHPSPATSSRHGGDPDTVETVDQSVRSYSPSPYRFPIFLTALCSSPPSPRIVVRT